MIITCIPVSISAMSSQRNALVEEYFHKGLHYKGIVLALSTQHHISISLRHVKCILKRKDLTHRKDNADINDAFAFISEELAASGALHGYR